MNEHERPWTPPDAATAPDGGDWPDAAPQSPPLRADSAPGAPGARGSGAWPGTDPTLEGFGLAAGSAAGPPSAGSPSSGSLSSGARPAGGAPPSPPLFTPPPVGHPPSPPPRSTGGGWRAATVALAATTLFAGGFAIRGVVDPDTVEGSSPTTTGASTVPIDLSDGEPAAEVAAVLGPAVVQIERGDGLGSGVIYDESGLILTNAHVVGSGSSADVRLADGTLLEGRVLGADEARDLAVISVDADGDLPVAELALGGLPGVGQTAIALGSPFGLTQSVTSGIVSAVDRPVDGTDVLIGMIQTDAPINPGNSGGALADRSGRVVGINSSILSQNGENNGIGFAIPIDVAVETARRIVEGESLDVARIGVSSDPDGPSDGSPGALVGDVSSGGAADDVGIEEGDVIVAVGDEAVTSFSDLAVKISKHFPGDEVTVEVQRDGKTRTLEVTLGSD